VASAFLEKNKNLSQETSKYWQVISDRSYHFKKWQNIAASVVKIQKNEVVQFFDKYIAQYAPCLKKLCILVYSQKHMETFNDSALHKDIRTIYESDMDDFRKSMSLFSIPNKAELKVQTGIFED
jgi:secreted Zn-dependent insulinase-like peptidase